MSCFIVTDATMQRAVSALHDHRLPCEAADKLGRDLWELNFRAWDNRYPNEKTTTTDREIVATWRWTGNYQLDNGHGVPVNRRIACAWLKSLTCLRYQCSQDNCTETLLYEQMTKKMHQIALSIVAELPEYESAKWE